MSPKIGLVPIGDRFTMGGAVAALACRRYFNFETVVPCHYGTFGMIDQTPEKFIAGMEGSGVDGELTPKIGDGAARSDCTRLRVALPRSPPRYSPGCNSADAGDLPCPSISPQ